MYIRPGDRDLLWALLMAVLVAALSGLVWLAVS